MQSGVCANAHKNKIMTDYDAWGTSIELPPDIHRIQQSNVFPYEDDDWNKPSHNPLNLILCLWAAGCLTEWRDELNSVSESNCVNQ